MREYFVEPFTKNLAFNILETHGIVCLANKNFEDYKSIISDLGSIVPHRDSDEDGMTRIKEINTSQVGHLGFSSKGLNLHTDRSCLKNIPSLVANLFFNQSFFGGESIFVDSKLVYIHLEENHPTMLKTLTTDISLFFDRTHLIKSSIFFRLPNGRMGIRFRNDNCVSFGNETEKVLLEFQNILNSFSFIHKFSSGDIYILDNTRLLHGRMPYQGDRLLIRALIKPTTNEFVNGFEIKGA